VAVDPSTERQLDRQRLWNIAVGLILAVQAVLIAVLTNGFSLPVRATFMNGPPGTTPGCTTRRCLSIDDERLRRGRPGDAAGRGGT